MLHPLRKRNRRDEWMDAPDADPATLHRSLRFIRRINALLGYTRATLWHLERFSRNWKHGEKIRMIDLATGSGDVPRAILRWADARGFNVQIVAVDRNPTTARAASRALNHPRLQVVQADVMELPFADQSFDYALTAMFLHHLDDEQAVQVLQRMSRLARRGIIAADLLRHYRAYAWITLLTLLAGPMVRHDARTSVAQAFKRDEVLVLRERAGIEFAEYFRHFGHRFVLAGEKP
jgi:ubiquinone/menaquinone biosynthesis C-methylase UbiE